MIESSLKFKQWLLLKYDKYCAKFFSCFCKRTVFIWVMATLHLFY